jgi:dolichol-phosphate mannosyltransferase
MEDEIRPVLSIVMPVYNEEDAVGSVIRGIYSTILSRLPGAELLAIDDGSRDRTPLILDDLAKRYPQIRPFHKDNGGHGSALLFGLQRARGEHIFLTDSDGQTDPADFWILWDKRQQSDFVTGVRADRHDPQHRLWIARFLRLAIRALFGVRCRDANVPFKLMSRDFWEKTKARIPEGTLTPSLFLCLAAKRGTNSVIETDIRHLPRETGECTIRYMRLMRFCVRALGQFLKFRFIEWRRIEPASQASEK